MFLLSFLLSIIGAFFRRWWGGWEAPLHWLKILVGFALTLTIGVSLLSLKAGLWWGVCMGASFLNPVHGKAMAMGTWKDKGGLSWLGCFALMAGSYGGYGFLGSLGAWLLGAHWAVLAYPLIGLPIAGIYALSFLVFNKFFKNPDGSYKQFWHTGSKTINGVVTQEWFIDCPTAVGELGLGACIFAGLPLVLGLFP
jgi:hypothetical protein